MGFNSVYQTLKELFPQLDARLLKAVAIEYPKDADSAVISILTDVLPYISNQSSNPTSAVGNNDKTVEPTASSSSMPGSIGGGDTLDHDMLNDERNTNSGHLIENNDDSADFYDAEDKELISFRKYQEAGSKDGQEKMLDINSVSLTAEGSKNDYNNELENHVGEALVPSNECQDAAVHVGEALVPSHECQDAAVQVNETGNVLSSSIADDGRAEVSSSNNQNGNSNCHNVCVLNTNVDFDSYEQQAFLDRISVDFRVFTDQASASVQDNTLDALDSTGCDSHVCVGENQEIVTNEADVVEESPVIDAFGAKDDILSSTIVTRSGQICRINLLEDIIVDAKNYKETLFSAMESVIGLVKEVEVREKEAQDTKEAAAKGGLEILEKVKEVKTMLKHAKEANDMHAGEVYGEKSILATEVKELQTRLLGLSDEKDKSISILDEMRETLEARLRVAEEERRIAEQELFDKEKIARGALAEQELIMEKVVHESKLLEQEAEENSKLRDFLMEKGHVVDTLQGEICVICQDVKLLKENFDNRVSISKPLSFKQTSGLLGSSNSSVKSVASVSSNSSVKSVGSDPLTSSVKSTASSPVPGETGLESPGRMSRTSSAECTPRSSVNEGVKAAARKELLDDDWELFDF